MKAWLGVLGELHPNFLLFCSCCHFSLDRMASSNKALVKASRNHLIMKRQMGKWEEMKPWQIWVFRRLEKYKSLFNNLHLNLNFIKSQIQIFFNISSTTNTENQITNYKQKSKYLLNLKIKIGLINISTEFSSKTIFFNAISPRVVTKSPA